MGSNNNNNSFRKQVVVVAGAIVLVLLFGVASHYHSGAAESSPTTAMSNLLRLQKSSCYKKGNHSCQLGDDCYQNSDCPFVGPKDTACCVYFEYDTKSCGTEGFWTVCTSTGN